ncbi:retrovirus-related pol polyprotein from transposon opus [Plakobranchus ocellatus]|uniref:Retrovirus-related pol polyprotein from transposon opus n=1 Tax=Plakobranchus ocellatus TaxID=259542 RepID=A0AAV4CMI0_9GAST|nr:retrovirus-related pol polyprotein from transposon opus [Plakobranchus ocellatus]
MVYGRVPRGPIEIWKEMLECSQPVDEEVPVFQYLADLRERLSTAWDLATSSAEAATARTRGYKNKNSCLRTFEIGDKVLLLLPTNNSKLLLTWRGPFSVTRKISDVDYEIEIDGTRKTFHVNMLQKFHERPQYLCDEGERSTHSICTSVVDMKDYTSPSDCEPTPEEATIELPALTQTQSYKDVDVGAELTDAERQDVENLLSSFSDVLTDLPGCTNLIEHRITLTTNKIVCLKPYKLPFRSREIVEKEVKEMLRLGVIEPSTSAYSSPIVLVNKPDGTVRFCIDFRRLNSITIKDAEPIPYQEELLASFGQPQVVACDKGEGEREEETSSPLFLEILSEMVCLFFE